MTHQEMNVLHKQQAQSALPNLPKFPEGPDGLMLAFFSLLETAVVTSHTAMIRGKELQANASAQIKLNDQNAALNFKGVPKEIIDHHSIKHWHHHLTGRNVTTWTYTVFTWKTSPNSALIARDKAFNAQVFADRQMITQKINTLEQAAQTSASNITIIANSAADTDAEAAKLLSVEDQLTYDACLTQPGSS